MKNLASKLSAFLAAAVMTFSAAGISASADNETDTPKYTGWSLEKNGWQYLENGVPYKGKPYKIDGIYYDFSENGYCEGKYRGWSKTGRYYRRGVPYTGWNELYSELNEYGYYDYMGNTYCIDGYPIPGKLQLGYEVYYFDEHGITFDTEPLIADLEAICAEKISVDAEEISVTVKIDEDYEYFEYTIGTPQKMERWEKGKWVSCGNPSEYAVDDIAYAIGGEDGDLPRSAAVTFYPKRYMGGNMPAGFYRITIPIPHSEISNYSRKNGELYAIFEAVPQIEVSMPEEPYLADNAGNTEVSILVTAYSEKKALQPEALADSLKLELMKKTVSGWESCKINGYSTGYTDNANELKIDAEFTADAEYYKAVLNFGGKDYSIAFHTVFVEAVPWLDKYSLKSDDITVIFTLHNEFGEPVKICTDRLTCLYKKENGKWTDMRDSAARYSGTVKDPSYTVLDDGERIMLCFDLSELYDTSKLEAGNYAVFIGGVGYAEFKLTDEETKSDNLPFGDIKAEDVKEIKFLYRQYGGDDDNEEDKVRASFKSGSYFERTLDYLRQMKFKNVYENYSNDDPYADWLEVTVRLNGGRKKTLLFLDNEAVVYNGNEVYTCSKYVYSALYDFLLEVSGLDYYYGYRRY